MPPTKKKSSQTKVNGSSPTRLYRSERNRVLGGVSGGLGDFFNVDPTLIRLIFVLATIFGGGGILLYLVLWLIIPSESQSSEITNERIKGTVTEMRDRAHEFAKEMKFERKIGARNPNTRAAIGVVILFLGVIFLFNNLGIFRMTYLVRFWPLVLIFFAIAILMDRN